MVDSRGGEAWVEVARVHDPARVGLVRSVLDSAGIDYLTEGEAVQGVLPVAVPGFFMDRGLGVVIRVRPEDLEDARHALEEQAIGPDEPDEPPPG
ncbi:MAG TPA: DUF2007 domain-containing protein [Thermoanaerobaculia bacterium]